MPGRTAVVLGGTGQQGGAVARHLLASGWAVRCLIRDPHSERSGALRSAGAELSQGDLDDEASVAAAFKDVDALFSVQTMATAAGVDGEVRQGKLVAELASECGIAHVVYSSVAGANKHSGVPHFESKWLIEEYARSLSLPLTVIRPAFFMDNFNGGLAPKTADGVTVVRLPLPPEARLQMVSTEDIGRVATRVFADADAYLGIAIDLAADDLAAADVASVFGAELGTNSRFEQQPVEEIERFSSDAATMFRWIASEGFGVDMDGFRQTFAGLGLLTLADWLAAERRR